MVVLSMARMATPLPHMATLTGVRAVRSGVMLSLMTAMLFVFAGSAHALDVVPLPMKGPPGATVAINATSCPADTTDTVAVRFRAGTGSAPAFDPSETGLLVVPAPGGAAIASFRVPTDTALGVYTFDAFCVSEGGGVVDGPQSAQFEVALLPVTVSPREGPTGTQLTVSGGGCPTGVTDQVFVRIEGASDEATPFEPSSPNQFSTAPNADGTFSLSFAAPADLELGENSVLSFCVSEGGSPLAGPGFGVFIVREADLPGTGSQTLLLTLVGVGALAAGGTLARRSRTRV